jgi:LacI family transcriptional regulator
MRGVVEYRQHAEHFRVVGPGRAPMRPLDQIDLTAVDGVLGDFRTPKEAQTVRDAGVAAVSVSSIRGLRLPRVGCEDGAIGRMGAEYLLGRGFVHLAYYRSKGMPSFERRYEAFRDVVKSAGLPQVALFDPQGEPDDWPAATADWLSRLPKPVGVMASQDKYGRELIDAALALGFRVPDAVAVLGVNNESWRTQLALVQMSSIDTNMARIAYLAAQALDAILDGRAVPPNREVPPVGVVTRRSTAVLPVEDPMIGEALAFIRDHCGEGICVEDVRAHVVVSRRNLELRMKRALGKTPQVAILAAQVERAKWLLTSTDMPIEQISSESGFRQPARLNQVFKRHTGLTPGQYRRERKRGLI